MWWLRLQDVRIAGVDVRIIDEAGAQVAAGERGQIVVQGIGLMRGYLDDPEATSATMRDGWLATGDVGSDRRRWQSAHCGSSQGHGGGRRSSMRTRPRSSGSSWRARQCGRRRSLGCLTSGWARCRAFSLSRLKARADRCGLPCCVRDPVGELQGTSDDMGRRLPSSQCGGQGGKGRAPFRGLFTSRFESEGQSLA